MRALDAYVDETGKRIGRWRRGCLAATRKNQREARQPIGSFSRDSDSEQVRAVVVAMAAMQESEE
ncbi:hypothetical protein CPter91_1996 [Collimonas pratensis]|uniref:Uncharacterized protein n=1 Tax=Collimonas pratensis TaxID=279113 RepID=A0A127Q2R0_9BURK|nr:hypothetical protein CPter91_1996 [Collimonas pratensis]